MVSIDPPAEQRDAISAVFELSPAESTIIWFCWQSFHSGCRPTPTPDRHNEAPAPDEDDVGSGKSLSRLMCERLTPIVVQNARPRMAKRSGPVAADVSIETHTTHNHITSLKLLAAAVPFTVRAPPVMNRALGRPTRCLARWTRRSGSITSTMRS